MSFQKFEPFFCQIQFWFRRFLQVQRIGLARRQRQDLLVQRARLVELTRLVQTDGLLQQGVNAIGWRYHFWGHFILDSVVTAISLHTPGRCR